MSRVSSLAGLISNHGQAVVLVLLLASVAISAGATRVEQTSSLEQFQSETPEANALDYIEANFSTGPENTTTVQLILRDRDGNVLDKSSLMSQLRFAISLRSNETVNSSLIDDRAILGMANIVATTSIYRERG
ncbi:MAG: Patched family protein, partial [Halobacteriaceae archaeon]